ncbi:hypothetical protein [Microseira wollei]|uniref:Uncharacterized protein n=1 Tax=Microseira wollei NIES-4236 TaxID=2530354 RepID=A0AAV3X738_9CYAN|nr:hypothetical protein [Microseira wollei]GET38687.1 hypothetical protein MiSe_34460 [Microseira wollei NIES-4236]
MSNPSLAKLENQSMTEFELNMLEKEYFFRQNTIEDYNKQIWAIKALGISGTAGVLALMLQMKISARATIGCSIPLFFWILESQWKHFQRGFYPRVAEIETILINCGYCSPGIYGGWSRTLKRSLIPKRQGYLWDGLFNPTVYVTYVLQIGFLLVMAAIAPGFLK